MRRIGVFGGTFNPPHIAHLIAAEEVRQQMNLEKILFIPSANPPLKNNESILPVNMRYDMTALAIAGNKYFELSDIEIKLAEYSPDTSSYTVNTLIALRKTYKASDFKLYLIIGMDQLAELDKWYQPGKLFLLSEVIAVNKPGYTVKDVKNEFLNRVTLVPVRNIDISSSELRNRVAEGKTIRYLVPYEVEKYIYENKLYQ